MIKFNTPEKKTGRILHSSLPMQSRSTGIYGPAHGKAEAANIFFDFKTQAEKGMFLLLLCLLLVTVLPQNTFGDNVPPLPSGLGGAPAEESTEDQPGLPSGLGAASPAEDQGPSLPSGLMSDKPAQEKKPAADKSSIWPNITGFMEARYGIRLRRDPYEKDTSIGEARLQVELEKALKKVLFRGTADFYYDTLANEHSIEMEKGKGFIDLREANFSFSAFGNTDIKVGRQILTWGTGDLLFINDLFPKDWQSFLSGRDTEYLKAPSDAVKVSIYSGAVNVDIVYTPKFDSDRFITGERLSYFNGYRDAGSDSIVQAERPDNWLKNDEWAVRFFKNINGNEFALYGYRGYWKSPAGADTVTFRNIFPGLYVYGLSIRGQAGKGIGNIEAGYYDSADDSSGDNPFINNGQFRFLAGYEQDLPALASDLTVGFQYYLEHMLDYDEYLRSLPAGSVTADENRHVITARITKLYLNQNLRCSLFTFYSPSDQDMYARPNMNYKISDNLQAELGINLFMGQYSNTFFGQFHNNTNSYMALRYYY